MVAHVLVYVIGALVVAIIIRWSSLFWRETQRSDLVRSQPFLSSLAPALLCVCEPAYNGAEMHSSRILAFGLAVLLAGNAAAGLATLVRQFVGETPRGERELVCVYRLGDKEFEHRYPLGNWCPTYSDEGAPTHRDGVQVLSFDERRPEPVRAAQGGLASLAVATLGFAHELRDIG
jgi:hypothetical protein